MRQRIESWVSLARSFGKARRKSGQRRAASRRIAIEPLERRELLALSIGIDTLPAVAETAAQVVFPVTRTGTPAELSAESQVRFFTASNTAVSTGVLETTDFLATSGVLTFSADETQEFVTVTIAGDVRVEANETFLVKLADPTGSATLDAAKSQSVLTITDNDAIIVVGPDADSGSPVASDHRVHVFEASPTHPEKFSFEPYGTAWYGGIRVATADFNADGIPDIVTGAGPGGTAHVKVYKGRADGGAPQESQDLLWGFNAYPPVGGDPGFGGGVYVATGDVSGDGVPDVVTAAGEGGGPHIKVFNGAGAHEELFGFMAWSNFTGGVRLAVSDFNGDGRADIVAAQGPATQPDTPSKVRIFSGLNHNVLLLNDLEPYAGFMAGIYVAAGETNGDGCPELVTAAGAATHVKIYDGAALSGPELYGFFAYQGFGGGARIGVGDTNGDALVEIVTSPGVGGGPHVRVFSHRGVEQFGFMAGPTSVTGGIYVDSEAAQKAREHIRIIDNSQAGFSVTGNFANQNNGGFLGGSHYAQPPATGATATWTFNNLVPGLYRVSTSFTVHEPSRPGDAPYEVFDGAIDGDISRGTQFVDQRYAVFDLLDAHQGFQTLGGPAHSYLITGSTLKVTVRGDDDKWTSADAVRIERLAATPVITVPGSQSVPEDASRIFNVANGNRIVIDDKDAGGTVLTTTLAVTAGTLSLASTALPRIDPVQRIGLQCNGLGPV